MCSQEQHLQSQLRTLGWPSELDPQTGTSERHGSAYISQSLIP